MFNRQRFATVFSTFAIAPNHLDFYKRSLPVTPAGTFMVGQGGE